MTDNISRQKKHILYLCDEKKCYQGKCLNPKCWHTTDPSHRRKIGDRPAVFIEDDSGNLWEEISPDALEIMSEEKQELFSDVDGWVRRKLEGKQE